MGGVDKRPTADSSGVPRAMRITIGCLLGVNLHAEISHTRVSGWKALKRNRETRAHDNQRFQFLQTIVLAGRRIGASKRTVGGQKQCDSTMR